MPDLDPDLQSALRFKDDLMVALRAFQEHPDVTTRGKVLELAVQLDRGLRWLQTDAKDRPGASFVAALVDLALDRARREVDVDIYLREPAAPVRRLLDTMLDQVERVEDTAELLRSNPESDDLLRDLETTVVTLTGMKNELVGLQRQTWRTAAVDHNLERTEDCTSRARALIRQVNALRDPRMKRATKDTLRVLVQTGS